jgi:signal transduction histidine kinase
LANPAFNRLRSLQLGLVVICLWVGAFTILWTFVFLPADSALSELKAGLLVLFLGAIPWLRWRPQDSPWIASLLSVGACGAMLLRGWQSPPGAFPTIIDLLPFTLFLSVIFGAGAFADLLAALVVAALLLLLRQRPWLAEPLALRHLTNVIVILAVQQIIERAFWNRVIRATRELQQLSESLQEQALLALRMAASSFQEIHGQVRALRAALDSGVREASVSAVKALARELAQVRGGLAAAPEPPAPGNAASEAAQLRQRLRAYLSYAGFIAVGLTTLRNVLLKVPDPGWNAAILAVQALSIAVQLLHPRGERWAFRAATTVFLAVSLLTSLKEMAAFPGTVGATQCSAAFAVVMVALVDAPGYALSTLALFLGSLAYAALFLPDFPWGTGTVVAVCIVPCVWVAQRLPREVFEGLVSQNAALDQTLRRRRRLISMLFHDLANPLQVIAIELELRSDTSRGARLAARLEGMLDAAKELDEAKVETDDVDLGTLLEGLADPYQERLASKALQLDLQYESCSVRVQPQLLREGVLANLLGNAIKFAPVGSTIEIRARKNGNRVELSIGDQGPGIPLTVLEAIGSGQRAPSTAGSLGETGNGYGLGLVQDYLAQMGGDLRFGIARDGGTLAMVRLKSA